MSLNWKEIALILEELPLPGSSIQRVIQHDFHSLSWDLYHPREGRWRLYSEIGTPNSRIHRVSEGIAAVQQMKTAKLQRFIQFSRKHLEGARIVKAEQAPFDRLVTLTLDNHGTPLRLIFRLYSGSRANIIVTDAEDTIMDLLYRRPSRGEASGRKLILAPSPPPVRDFSVRSRTEGISFNRQIEEEYGRKSNEETLASLRSRVTQKRDREMASLETTEKNLARKASENAGYELFKLYGDLLSASLFLVPPHAKSVTLDDYTTGGKRTIALDEKLSPVGNAQAWYERYRRAKGTWENSLAEYEKAKAAIAKRAAHYEEVLRDEEDERVAIRRLRKELSALTADRKEVLRSPGLTFSSGKFTLLVGRNAKENDALLRHWVKSHDYWMHTRDTPGAYVFIRGMKGKSVPLEVLLDAGNLAVFYSKSKGRSRCDLYYTQVKYLRRAKDGPPGLVIPTQEKNFPISVDDTRLKRVLSTKEGNDAEE